MIAPLLLLAAQAAPFAAQPAREHNCVRAAGSEIMVCGTPPSQTDVAPPSQDVATSLPQGSYRLMNLRPRSYGPPAAQADLGHGVRATLRGQSVNAGRRRANKSVATLSVPF